VASEEKHLERVVSAVREAREAEARACAAQQRIRDEIRAAPDAGVPLTAIARALGVSRQRVQQLARQP
jgi:hypothetical protein